MLFAVSHLTVTFNSDESPSASIMDNLLIEEIIYCK